VASARAALVDLADALPSGVLEDVRLLVSELVTNSIRHAGIEEGGGVELRVLVSQRVLRVEVVDGGRGFEPASPGPSADMGSGWGLYLVDRIADRWGTRPTDPGTCVWFEIDLAPPVDPAGTGGPAPVR
jgi:anti-sigma regulatory factor (Ser/Thr protein kinase)